MLGDVLLINELHKKAAESVYKYFLKEISLKKKGYRFIVAISGESGAGKSELSHSLALVMKRENLKVKILHTDNYYKTKPAERNQWRKEQGIENVGINEYDWNLLNRNIREFKEGNEALMPCVDIVSQQTDKLITDFSEIDLLIIDGLYAIKTKDADLKVYIDLTYHDTKKTREARNKEAINSFRDKVLEREHQNILSLKSEANLIVTKDYKVEKI